MTSNANTTATILTTTTNLSPSHNEDKTPTDPLYTIAILPPLQNVDNSITTNKKTNIINSNSNDTLILPPLNSTEPILSIRTALQDVRMYAHYTSYRLVYNASHGDVIRKNHLNSSSRLVAKSMMKKKKKITNLISKYTGVHAFISPSPFNMSLCDKISHIDLKNTSNSSNLMTIVDDFGDLSQLPTLIEDPHPTLRIVLQRYDLGCIREHVNRLRTLFDGHAPSLESLIEEESNNTTTTATDSTKEERVKVVLPSNTESTVIKVKNLCHFYSLACGEEVKNNTIDHETELQTRKRLIALDNKCHVNCSINFSGFHPPPPYRKVLGDLAYLEVKFPSISIETVIHITAISTGFYINKSTTIHSKPKKFNPCPSNNHCFSHTLLDCLLQSSKSFRNIWEAAVLASKERAEFNKTSVSDDSPLQALKRAVTRGDIDSTISGTNIVDSVTLRPSWIVPQIKSCDTPTQPIYYENNTHHTYNVSKLEDEFSNLHGLEIKSGCTSRDWNEELQTAREFPVSTLQERLDRARLIHRILSDFADASIAGAKAIFDKLLTPMNPNEPIQSHVYFHNNIFFSRAVDAGIDTFKFAEGNVCAKKYATREGNCISTIHKLDISGLYTPATVIVDYLGTRLVCQSIVPGILQGEKGHTVLYGSVEALSPLSWEEKFHKKIEDNLGKSLLVATRNYVTFPLTEERMEYIEKQKVLPSTYSTPIHKSDTEITSICGPLEMKGIRGSDQRDYCLDVSRLTPRDANWVGINDGGTGNFEKLYKEELKKNTQNFNYIPPTVDDHEWITAVLRPELIIAYTRYELREHIETKVKNQIKGTVKVENDLEITRKNNYSGKDSDAVITSNNSITSKITRITPTDALITIDDKKSDIGVIDSNTNRISVNIPQYMQTSRLNVNVFLPHLKSLETIDPDSYKQLQEDEHVVRIISSYLFHTILPEITKEVQNDASFHAPIDGKELIDFLHQRGVNCRYLGRLASLAVKEEARDREAQENKMKNGNKYKSGVSIPRHRMPEYWLDILELEMLARASSHVLNKYLILDGVSSGVTPPSFIIASFLSVLMSTCEETASQTEKRVNKQVPKELDDEDIHALGMFPVNNTTNSHFRSRMDVWKDIETEIGCRYRYVLTLYNIKDKLIVGSTSRALYLPLLRRVCQRAGIRLAAKNYIVGGPGVCNFSPRGKATFPISPIDIMNVIPMVKHTAGDGFIPVIHTASSIIPYIHVLLPDAKVTYDAAQAHFQANNLPQALECIQESTSLYQKVVESVLHISICKCLTLFAIILYQVNEVELALKNSCRAMAIAVQIGGFDCSEAVTAHSTLSHILINVGNIASGVQHIRASIYLMELMAGPRYIEISNSYHKLGTLYYDIGNLMNGLRFYQESAIRTNRDRVMEGIFWRKTACVLTALNHFKRAFDAEKRAYIIFRSILGEEDEYTKGSSMTLKYLMRKAIEQSIQAVDDERKKNGKVVDREKTDKTILNLTETKVLCNKDNDSRKQQRKRRKKKTKKK